MKIIGNDLPEDHFDNRPVKEFLEHNLYRHAGNRMESNVVQITGPALERHVTGPALERHVKNALMIAKTVRCRIHCIEISRRIFKEMERRWQHLSPRLKKMVKIHNCDIANHHINCKLRVPSRFEDLDLCQSLHMTKYLIAYRLQIQSSSYTKRYDMSNKCMMFTSALRPTSRRDYMKDINTVLAVIGSEIDSATYKVNNVRYGIRSITPTITKPGRMTAIGIFSYQDASPMMSCIIFYK